MSESRRISMRWSLVAVVYLLPMAAQAQDKGMPADFVSLRTVDASIRQDMRYAGDNNFTGHPLPGYDASECLLQRPVALALKRAQADLAAQGLSLKVYDCYRPARAVAAMARWAHAANVTPDTSRFYPRMKKSWLFELGFIASHSAHSRGVAVDLTVVPKDGPPPAPYDTNVRYGSCAGPAAARAPDDSLDMGTSFDCFSVRSYTRNASITAEQRARRMVLLQAMARHGFVNYKREWWHFSYPAADPRAAYDVPIGAR